MMMFTSARMRTSISVLVFVAPILPTDGNLRHNAGGLHFEAPSPSTPRSCPSAPLHSLSREKASVLHRQAPRTRLQAVEASPCYYEKTNVALHLTQQAEMEGNAGAIFVPKLQGGQQCKMTLRHLRMCWYFPSPSTQRCFLLCLSWVYECTHAVILWFSLSLFPPCEI